MNRKKQNKKEATNNDELQQKKNGNSDSPKINSPKTSTFGRDDILGQREMPGGWFGLEATEEQERNWAAKRAAAKLVRASDGDARAAKKQRKIDSGGYANPATRCGGNALVCATLSNVYHPSYLWDGKPPGIGPYSGRGLF